MQSPKTPISDFEIYSEEILKNKKILADSKIVKLEKQINELEV